MLAPRDLRWAHLHTYCAKLLAGLERRPIDGESTVLIVCDSFLVANAYRLLVI